MLHIGSQRKGDLYNAWWFERLSDLHFLSLLCKKGKKSIVTVTE